MAQVEQSTEVVHVVARNLARLRAQQSWSLSELAQRSGVAKATLSALEAGRGNPTLETLWQLSNTLRVPFSDLVTAPPRDDVHITRITDLPTIGIEGEQARLLDRLTGHPLVEVFDLTCPPRTDRLSPSHGPGVIEALLLLDGQLLIGPEGQTRLLHPGELMHFPADREHRYINAHPTPAHAIVWIAYPAR